MEKKYIAKFALVFYGFLVLGNMITTFFISYRISLFARAYFIVFNSFLFSRVFVENTKLRTTCASIFFTSIFVEEFVHYIDELLPNNKKY